MHVAVVLSRLIRNSDRKIYRFEEYTRVATSWEHYRLTLIRVNPLPYDLTSVGACDNQQRGRSQVENNFSFHEEHVIEAKRHWRKLTTSLTRVVDVGPYLRTTVLIRDTYI